MLEGVRSNIKRYAELGMEVHFSEIDVSCKPGEAKKCENDVWSEADLELQASIYETLLTICIEESNCTYFGVWGLSDKYSWLSEPQNGLPIAADYKPKLAHSRMIDTLQTFKRDHPALATRRVRYNNIY